jgi:hypothetical protein
MKLWIEKYEEGRKVAESGNQRKGCVHKAMKTRSKVILRSNRMKADGTPCNLMIKMLISQM